MDTLSLMTLILASVTFLLACAAFITIWQNHQLRKTERKERLLNEIIEWASDVGSKCAFESDPNEKNAKATLDGLLDFMQSMSFINLHKSVFETGYKQVSWKGEYIKKVADVDFKEKMMSAGNLVEELKKHLKMLHDEEIGKNSVTTPKIAQKIAQHNLTLDKLTKATMEEAAKIKTGDIS